MPLFCFRMRVDERPPHVCTGAVTSLSRACHNSASSVAVLLGRPSAGRIQVPPGVGQLTLGAGLLRRLLDLLRAACRRASPGSWTGLRRDRPPRPRARPGRRRGRGSAEMVRFEMSVMSNLDPRLAPASCLTRAVPGPRPGPLRPPIPVHAVEVRTSVRPVQTRRAGQATSGTRFEACAAPRGRAGPSGAGSWCATGGIQPHRRQAQRRRDVQRAGRGPHHQRSPPDSTPMNSGRSYRSGQDRHLRGQEVGRTRSTDRRGRASEPVTNTRAPAPCGPDALATSAKRCRFGQSRADPPGARMDEGHPPGVGRIRSGRIPEGPRRRPQLLVGQVKPRDPTVGQRRRKPRRRPASDCTRSQVVVQLVAEACATASA